MSLSTNELYAEVSTTPAPQIRPYDAGVERVHFAAVATAITYESGTPVCRNRSTGFWVVWTDALNEIQSITVDATGGTFTITHDGQTTAAIAFDATAAAVKTALVILGAFDENDLTVTGGPGDAGGTTPYLFEFHGRFQGQDMALLTTNAGSLTGGAGTAVVAEDQAGSNLTGIEGFVYGRDVNVEVGAEVIGNVMLRGEILASDVKLPAGESQANLDIALKEIYTVHGVRNLDVRELFGAK
jgi:hypothetical protein